MSDRPVRIELTHTQAQMVLMALVSHRQHLDDNDMINSSRVISRAEEKIRQAMNRNLAT